MEDQFRQMNSQKASMTPTNVLDVLPMGTDPAVQASEYAVLAVDDSEEFLSILKWYLGKCQPPYGPFHVSSVNTLAAAKQFLGTHSVDCVVLDLTLPDARNLDGLRGINEVAGGAAVVIVNGLDEEAMAAKAIRAGAQDCYQKSPQLTGLEKMLLRAIRRQAALNTYREQVQATETELRTAVEVLTSQLTRLGPGHSPAPIRNRSPELFTELADTYLALLLRRRDALVGNPAQDEPEVKDLAIRTGHLLGGGVDIVNMHREAMKTVSGDAASSRIVAGQSRLLSFQVLAELADFYRDTFGGEPSEL
jgi:DNA-binding response OmpR family regulator